MQIVDTVFQKHKKKWFEGWENDYSSLVACENTKENRIINHRYCVQVHQIILNADDASLRTILCHGTCHAWKETARTTKDLVRNIIIIFIE